MLSAPATDEQIGKVVKLVTDVDAKMPRTQVIREQSSRKYNSAVKLVDAIATEINGVGKNLFGVWNGVTRYTTHDASGTIEGRLKSKMIGNLQKTDESVLEAMKQLIQEGKGILA